MCDAPSATHRLSAHSSSHCVVRACAPPGSARGRTQTAARSSRVISRSLPSLLHQSMGDADAPEAGASKKRPAEEQLTREAVAAEAKARLRFARSFLSFACRALAADATPPPANACRARRLPLPRRRWPRPRPRSPASPRPGRARSQPSRRLPQRAAASAPPRPAAAAASAASRPPRRAAAASAASVRGPEPTRPEGFRAQRLRSLSRLLTWLAPTAGAPAAGDGFPVVPPAFGGGGGRSGTAFGGVLGGSTAADDEDAAEEGGDDDEPPQPEFKPVCTLPEAPRVRAAAIALRTRLGGRALFAVRLLGTTELTLQRRLRARRTRRTCSPQPPRCSRSKRPRRPQPPRARPPLRPAPPPGASAAAAKCAATRAPRALEATTPRRRARACSCAPPATSG